ncbi:MAG: outer membrane protein assembly factor BamE domain-containing protein [Planctomycetota bacterium]|jgi:outer membrane protein assembly factor BamE (lipoprotein component of BamABCDE complex)
MTGRFLLAAALALGLGSGCTYIVIEQGTPLRPSDARRITHGDAKAEVLETLGAPSAMGHFPGGSWFEYSFRVTDTDQLDVSFLQASGSWASTEVRSDRLLVRFDRTGRVLDIGVPSGIGTER